MRGGIRQSLLAASRRSVGLVRGYTSVLYQRFMDLPRNGRESLLFSLDLVAVPLALVGALVLRVGSVAVIDGPALLAVSVGTVVVSAVVFLRLGLYRAIVTFMGDQAVIAIVKGVTLSSLTLSLLLLLVHTQGAVPRALPLLYWVLLLIMVGGSRLAMRSWTRERGKRGAIRVAIYGAGAAGRQLLSSLRCGERYSPVVFVDDNPKLQGRLINDVPVIPASALPDVIARHEVSEVFLAMAALDKIRRREIIRSLADHAVQVRSIPPFEDLVRGVASISEVEEISLEELLGRDPVPPHPDLLARCITGKCVLVTGAGGSIGSELCRQVLGEEPRELLLLDSSEYALYTVERELHELALRHGHRARIVPLLGSVQDLARMRRIMRHFGVQTVYHAAAYKHVPIVEYNVVEGVRNNVLGTRALARAAAECAVDTFVLVSTDKAVRPSNIMGATKRVAEIIMQALAAERPHTRFVIVRFGNVIGSSGSVIPLFRDQIARGGPVTVTHAEAERYFMTIPEAAQLVLQAGAMGSGGDVFVLDMGQPIRIVELARRMIHLAGLEVREEGEPGPGIELRLIGLRPGEKLREELLVGDDVSATGHPMILRAFEEFLPWSELGRVLDDLAAACEHYDCGRIRGIFATIVHGFDARYGCSDPLAVVVEDGRGRVERLQPVRNR
jgi:FlaA1/EpsC-like NDP-sugar epimerase